MGMRHLVMGAVQLCWMTYNAMDMRAIYRIVHQMDGTTIIVVMAKTQVFPVVSSFELDVHI